MYSSKITFQKTQTDIELKLNNHTIKPSTSVELLGFTIDQHLSYKDHIEKTTTKCRGLLGVINKAKYILPPKLLQLTFTALVRPHLEYCNLVTATASKANLNKLEVIQKIARRIICNEERDAHAAPLLQKLGLQSLEKRRETKILKTVDNILSNNCHPHLANMFQLDVNGQLANNETTRITFGKKRFCIYAKEHYNNFIAG